MHNRRLKRFKRKPLERNLAAIELQEFKVSLTTTQPIEYRAANPAEFSEPTPPATCKEKMKRHWFHFKDWAQEVTFRDFLHFVFSAVLIIPSTTADTSSFAVGLQGLDRDLLGHIKLTDSNITIIAIAYFLQSLMVNGPEVVDGINKSIRIIDKRELPAHWEKFSRKKEMIIGAISLLFTLYSSSCESLATYGFFSDLNWRNELSYTLAGIYFITNVLSEGRKTWENFRNKFCEVSSAPEHGWPATILGYLLASFSALGAITLGYDGLTSQFGTPGLVGKIALLTACLIKGYSDISYSGAINMGAMDECFEEVAKNGCPTLSQVVSVLTSLYFGGIAADALAVVYMTSLATAAFPFTVPALACSIIGYGVAVAQGVTITYGLTSLLNPVTAHLGKWMIDGVSYLCGSHDDKNDNGYQPMVEDKKPTVATPDHLSIAIAPASKEPKTGTTPQEKMPETSAHKHASLFTSFTYCLSKFAKSFAETFSCKKQQRSSSQPPEKSLEKAAATVHEKKPEKTPEKKPEKTPAKPREKTQEKMAKKTVMPKAQKKAPPVHYSPKNKTTLFKSSSVLPTLPGTQNLIKESAQLLVF